MERIRTKYRLNHKVMLTLDNAKNVADGLKRFDKEVFRISRVITKQINKTTNYWTTYELGGLVSEKGVPYVVLSEWLHDIGARAE